MTENRWRRAGAGVVLLAASIYAGSVYRRVHEVDRLKADLSPEEISTRARERANERRSRGLAGVELPQPVPVLTGATKSGYKSSKPERVAAADSTAGNSPSRNTARAQWRPVGSNEGSSSSAFLERGRPPARPSGAGTGFPASPAPSEYADPAIAAAAKAHLEVMARRQAQSPAFDPEAYVDSIPDYQERVAVLAAVGNVSPEIFGSYGKRASSLSPSGGGGSVLARASSMESSLGGGETAGASGGGMGGVSGGGTGGGVPGSGEKTEAPRRGPEKKSGAPDAVGKPVVDLKLDPKNMKPSGPPYAHDKGKPKTVQVYAVLPDQKTGPLYFQADMDIDADGAGGHYKSDKTGQSQTSLRDSSGRSLNPGTLPFYVLPSDFPKSHPGVKLGDIAIVQYNGKQVFAIYGDNGPKGMIGECSIACAKMLGINPNPNRGGAEGGVTYIVFPGSKLKSTPATASEIEAAAQPFLKALGPEFRKSDLLAEPSPE